MEPKTHLTCSNQSPSTADTDTTLDQPISRSSNTTTSERSGMTFTPYPHKEHHTSNGAWVRDAIIGFADGLTVPFALTAGLSSIGSSHLVILGGLAELFAGSISMGLGAYLAALTEKNHYAVELLRERREVESVPSEEIEEIYDIFQPYGVSRGSVEPLVKELVRDKEAWVRFMMVFELGLQEPASSRLYLSALVMGLSYFFGGLVPMIPYFAIKDVTRALFVSIGITVVILLAFGYVKAIVTGTSKRGAVRGALETLVVGVLAAGASYGIVKGLEGIRPVDVGK